MDISAHILQEAMELYLKAAYPDGGPAMPEGVRKLVSGIRALPKEGKVPLEMLEKEVTDSRCGYVLRLGQPMYPFMKLAIDECPAVSGEGGGEGSAGAARRGGVLLRVDVHDEHLHAAPGSPDAAWLASVRASNRDLSQKIEAAWAAAGLPTFKEFLRKQLERRKSQKG